MSNKLFFIDTFPKAFFSISNLHEELYMEVTTNHLKVIFSSVTYVTRPEILVL